MHSLLPPPRKLGPPVGVQRQGGAAEGLKLEPETHLLIPTPGWPPPPDRQLTLWEAAGSFFGGGVRGSKENNISLRMKGKLEVALGENTTGKAKPTISKMTFKVLQPMLRCGVRYHMNQVLMTEPCSVGSCPSQTRGDMR